MAKGWGKNQKLIKEGKLYCSSCKQVLPLDAFHPNKAQDIGYSSQCKECCKKGAPKRKQLAWVRKLKFHYGLLPEDYFQILKDQNNACAICSKPVAEDRKLAVDHDHETNKIRGLLCFHCNTLLGHAFDNTDILKSAIKYLEENRV